MLGDLGDELDFTIRTMNIDRFGKSFYNIAIIFYTTN